MNTASHGSVSNDFRKLIKDTAPQLPEDTLSNLARLMGPSDETNRTIPSGYTYFGQFIDHDITFTSEGGINARTPVFDLDSLYGGGPSSEDHAELYEPGINGNAIFKIGHDFPQSDAFSDGDLFRGIDFKAKIPDPRNDENIVIASLHLLFQKLHNKLVLEEGLSFDDAKLSVIWHYQSAVLNDFLVRVIGQARVDAILQNGRRLYQPKSESDLFIPTEFSGACYRFGHSMVRERYSFNDIFRNFDSHPNLFFGFPKGRPVEGGHQITKIWTLQGAGHSLERFFDPSILDPRIDSDNFSGKIDTKLPFVLFNLESAPGDASNILAHRNLITGARLEIANAQQTIDRLKSHGFAIDILAPEEIAIEDIPEEVISNTPLWYYTLREAEVREDGLMLGDLGSLIVGETIIGLLEMSSKSFIHPSNRRHPWPFTITKAINNKVSMLDIVRYVSD